VRVHGCTAIDMREEARLDDAIDSRLNYAERIVGVSDVSELRKGTRAWKMKHVLRLRNETVEKK
jgi:hypothetical protein